MCNLSRYFSSWSDGVKAHFVFSSTSRSLCKYMHRAGGGRPQTVCEEDVWDSCSRMKIQLLRRFLWFVHLSLCTQLSETELLSVSLSADKHKPHSGINTSWQVVSSYLIRSDVMLSVQTQTRKSKKSNNVDQSGFVKTAGCVPPLLRNHLLSSNFNQIF